MPKLFNNSSIGLGTWPLGGNAYGTISEEDAYNTLISAYNAGIRLFDTADIYGNGSVDKLLGSTLSSAKDVKIISKVGYISEKTSTQCFDEKHIRSSLEKTLKQLNRSKLDYYLLHSPPIHILNNRNVLKIFENLKEEGLTSKIGVSLRSIDTFKSICAWKSCESIEVIINLLDQRAIDSGLVDYCLKHKITVFARLPLCSGFLTGKYPAGSHFSKTDVRSRWPQKQIDLWCDSTNKYKFLINSHRNLAQAAVAFCLCSQVNAIPIPGMKSPFQVNSNIRAMEKECSITSYEFKEIRKVWLALKHVPPL